MSLLLESCYMEVYENKGPPILKDHLKIRSPGYPPHFRKPPHIKGPQEIILDFGCTGFLWWGEVVVLNGARVNLKLLKRSKRAGSRPRIWV